MPIGVTYQPEQVLPINPVYTVGEGWGEGKSCLAAHLPPLQQRCLEVLAELILK